MEGGDQRENEAVRVREGTGLGGRGLDWAGERGV